MKIIKLQGEAESRMGIHYEYDVDAVPLGEGGMGRVFKGYRIVSQTGEKVPVAIKAIYDNIPERVVEWARREASIQLDNDNLIRMHGFIETIVRIEGDEVKYKVYYHVIMELLVGVTLESILNGTTTDPNGMQIPFAAEIQSQYLENREAVVIRIMKAILLGLMALHDKGYIHRDIDPSNIMITADGKIKLIDFGICKPITSLESLDKKLTATGVFIGKVNYAAPELVLGDIQSQNYTTDIYALGILMFQLCAGRLPFSGTDNEIQSAHLRKALPMNHVRIKRLKKIICRATEKVQSKRYASVAELRVDLERISANKKEIEINTWVKVFVAIAFIATLLIVSVIYHVNKSNSQVQTEQLTCEEIYAESISLINQRDKTSLYLQGKDALRVLAEDSLYMPAKLKYYVMLINSNKPDEVKKGLNRLEKIALSNDSLNYIAMFECGLTLSEGNHFFTVPSVRQSLLNIKPNMDKANEWLSKSMAANTADYKSVYWMFNNLMRKKMDGTLPSTQEKYITKFYQMFEDRVKNLNDGTSVIYKKAIKREKATFDAWKRSTEEIKSQSKKKEMEVPNREAEIKTSYNKYLQLIQEGDNLLLLGDNSKGNYEQFYLSALIRFESAIRLEKQYKGVFKNQQNIVDRKKSASQKLNEAYNLFVQMGKEEEILKNYDFAKIYYQRAVNIKSNPPILKEFLKRQKDLTE